jgi:inner membrane protein
MNTPAQLPRYHPAGMDIISHALLGSATGFSALSAKLGRKALLLSAAGGMVPDIDFFLRPFADPALPGELHRHFTHSLVFVPVGGLIALLPFLVSKSIRTEWKLAWAATTLGCLTHAFLDCATSYGTLWFWPFSQQRVAWDMVAVIDPIFTAMLLMGVVIAAIAASRKPAAVALCAAALYLALGLVQNQRGLATQEQLAASRGHQIERSRVMPTLGNLIVWRSIYESDGTLHTDALRLPPFSEARMRQGDSIALFKPDTLPPGTPERVMSVVRRFSYFADGYVAAISDKPLVLGDLRYAAPAESIQPLWGLTLTIGNPHSEHTIVEWSTFFDARREAMAKLWDGIWSAEDFEPCRSSRLPPNQHRQLQ